MSERQTGTFQDMLQEELEARIEEIESDEYEYVPGLTRGDYIGMLVTAAACVVILIIGIL